MFGNSGFDQFAGGGFMPTQAPDQGMASGGKVGGGGLEQVDKRSRQARSGLSDGGKPRFVGIYITSWSQCRA
jgi:hypothetical protein